MSQKGFTPILVLVILVIIASAAYYLGTLRSKSSALPQFLQEYSGTPTSSPGSGSPRETEEPSLTWRTYTNGVRGYTIKYPPDWTLDNSLAETPVEAVEGATLVISKNAYRLTIYWPSAFGPGMCIFDDESRDNVPEMSEFCEGSFVSLTNENGSKMRRLVTPSIVENYVRWQVYTKATQYYATLPPTNYVAPMNYDPEKVAVMDKILSTFKSSN